MWRTLRAVAGHGPSPLASTVGIVAAIALTMALARVLLYSTGKPAASPSPSASALSTIEPVMTPTISASPAASLEPSGSPALTMGGTSFTTPGVLSAWKGFSASRPAAGVVINRILHWRGGYVAANSTDAVGPAYDLWTSPDGLTWTPVTSIDAAMVFESVAPGGLVAIGVDPSGPLTARSVWTSADGAAWRNAGTPDLPGTMVSMAGTDAGIVATVDLAAGGDGTTDTYRVEFSSDGIHWAPEAVNAGQTDIMPGSYMKPHVQAGNGRFFLMGAVGPLAGDRSSGGIVLAATNLHDAILWSDDGRTWTQAGGSYGEFASDIEFGRDGLLLNTYSIAIPGGNGLALSTDGGKTWQGYYDTFGPLGFEQCPGECSNAPDGAIGSNGTVFVAVKNGGKQAWLSYDGHTWSPVAWTGGDPSTLGPGTSGGFAVLPRGVLLADVYSAAK